MQAPFSNTTAPTGTWSHLHEMASKDGPPPQLPAAAPEITASSSSSNVIDITVTELSPQKIKEELFNNVMNGKWEDVAKIYTKCKPIVQTAMITKSKQTALHIAIMDNKIEAAKTLLDIVDAEKIKEMKNERENNPLHLAAAREQVGSIDQVFL